MPGIVISPTQMTNDWAREHVAAAYAPSKTFNLAGLIGSFHVIYSSYLRDGSAVMVTQRTIMR